MFVIGRSLHELIQIGNHITIKVLRIGEKRVTLGVDAPRTIPLWRGEAVPPPAANLSTAPLDSPLNALVIDDTPIHTHLVEKAFSAHGLYRTHVVTTAQAGLRLLGVVNDRLEQSLRFDLVLLEWQLPDLTGLEVVRLIRATKCLATLPLVVFSHWDSETEVTRCLQAGATAFISKPETQEGFRQTVCRIADFWSLARRAAPEFAAASESLAC